MQEKHQANDSDKSQKGDSILNPGRNVSGLAGQRLHCHFLIGLLEQQRQNARLFDIEQ
jgi:hypothetical protein